uniref:Pentacotripeptide-repeat region of PRORP domain-containing protein n=1 Tax=Alexandrium catenella TaxID=2925 RepID=A0A7S1RE49_ALECA
MVREMREAGVEIDSIVYNTALATCVAADRVDQARALLEEMERVGGVADVITYNTLAKGYAKAALMDRCFELFEHMRGQGIEPSQVTYGILLDGCINDSRVDRAAEVYERMTREGCPMNTVLYTTLIKGFARAGQADQAMRVYGQMRSEGTVPPDLITFSILIKSNCDSGQLEAALKLLEAMVDLRLRPDEVIFNNLLGGCVKDSNAGLAKRLYSDMTGAGIRPSNATFSILIRLYAQCKLLDEAVDMLRTEPAVQGVTPEPRLFSQLVLCCLRERQGRRAVDVYRLLLEHCVPTAAAHNSILGMCVKLNMLDTGVEILSLAASASGRVDERDAAALLEAARRKKRAQCADACQVAMRRLGLGGAATMAAV